MYCPDKTAAAAAAAGAAAAVTQQLPALQPVAAGVELLLWEEQLRKFAEVLQPAAAATATAAPAGPLPPAGQHCVQQQQRRMPCCSSNDVVRAGLPVMPVVFNYSAVGHSTKQGMNRLQQMIELQLMQALLQKQPHTEPVAAAEAAPAPAPAAAHGAWLRRSALLLQQPQWTSLELQQAGAAVKSTSAEPQGMQQQQQQRH
jgi:hypothetical protein